MQNERFTGRKEQEPGSYTRQKCGLIITRSFSFGGWQGSDQADASPVLVK